MCEDEVYKSLWSAENPGLCVTFFFFFFYDDRVLVSVIFFTFSRLLIERRRETVGNWNLVGS